MGIRIWHQSMTVLDDVPAYETALQERLPLLLRPDTEVVLHGLMPGTFPEAYPRNDLASSYLLYAQGNQWIEAGLEAERQGYDAIVLASMGNPMLREIRTLVNIPVIGFSDTVFRISGLYGRRFGMLFFNLTREDFWPEQVRLMGLQESFVGNSPAGTTFNDVMAAHQDEKKRAEVIAQVTEAGEKLARRGADVIVPGEMPLNLLLARAGVSNIGGATVIDGLAVIFKTAEMLVDLHRTSGMLQSRRGWFHHPPDPKRVEQVQEFYGLDKLQGRLQEGGSVTGAKGK